MRDNVINLQAVLPNGDVVKTGSRARKSAAGYDLARLIIGSEGTLGVITEVTVRLQKLPSHSVVGLLFHLDTVQTMFCLQCVLDLNAVNSLHIGVCSCCVSIYTIMALCSTPITFICS
jgi:FAD/FMN-containing dehydrogenase